MSQQSKPRVHWVSPLPPAQTDISHYTRRILPELAAVTDLTLWTDGKDWDWDWQLHDIARVRLLDPDRITLRDFALAGRPDGIPAPGPDVVMVNIGNAWPFHAGYLRMIQRIPSIVVLHDMAIQQMCFDAMRQHLFPKDVYEAEMLHWYGQAGLEAGQAVFNGEMCVFHMAHSYPGFELTLKHAIAVLTHTPVARDAVARAAPDLPTYLLDLPFRPSKVAPDVIRSGIGPMRFAQFGYSGPNRRLLQVLDALAPLNEEIDFRFDVMGNFWDPSLISTRAAELGIARQVQFHGFVDEAQLDACLAAAHLVFNLRNPTMGEASGSQLRIWNAAAPSVVTDLGWYTNLPDEAVFKIDPDDEIAALQRLIRQLSADPIEARAKGLAGRAQLESHHTPERYARGVAELATRFSEGV